MFTKEHPPQSFSSTQVNMKSLLEIMNQPLRAIPQETSVHTINKYNIWETPTKEPSPTKTTDIVPVAPLEMEPTTGVSQVYIK